jgi:hypothetical protein
MAKLSINFKEFLSHAHGNIEDLNKVFESFIKFRIIINAYYNYIV